MTDNNSTKIVEIQQEIDETKLIMHKNIDAVIEKGEKINLLVDKTENLRRDAYLFRGKTRDLKRRMCWDNYKTLIIIFFIILIISFFILALIYAYFK